MSAQSTMTSEYELVLMLDPEVPDERRDQIAADALKRIEAEGTLKQDRAWGMRKLAYEIRQRTEADYRFFRFETGAELLDDLDHSLKIADGVLRFRIFKVDPDSPVIEPPPPVALSSAAGGRSPGGRRGGAGDRPPRSAEPQPPAAGDEQQPAEPTAEDAGEEAPATPAPPAEAPAPESVADAAADQPPAEPAEPAEPAPGPPAGDDPDAR